MSDRVRSVRNHLSSAGLAGLLLAVLLVVAPSAASADPVAHDDPALAGAAGRLVVRLDTPAGPAERAAAAARLGGRAAMVVADDTFVVELDAGTVGAKVRQARADPGVVWAEPDSVYRSARLPDDECFPGCDQLTRGQTELGSVGAPDAWNTTTGSSSVVVAVLDTPANVDHPDLSGKVERGPVFTDPGRTCFNATEASHGTAVAGLVGARTNNTTGMSSLGWRTSVVSVGVLDNCGEGRASEIAAGIRWSADHGARVINLSLVGGANSALDDAVTYARASGVLVVAAAGNEGGTTPRYPAAYPGVVGVGATDNAGTAIASFSNTGTWVEVVAPGVGIFSTSTLTGGYHVYDGTSFASPLVAASAALVLAHRPELGADDLARRISWSAVRIPGSGTRVASGRLDAAGALVDPPAAYRTAASDGAVYALGEASYRGAANSAPLNRPIVGSAVTPSPQVGGAGKGGGYWLVASDGGIFNFGDAGFYGSTGAKQLNKPIVGMAPTPTGRGYWLVASDGGIFTFGDAAFFGSTGSLTLNQPIVGMSAHRDSGYWLVASDGGIFTFGSAPFHGSSAGQLPAPVVGMSPTRAGDGYWIATSAGHVTAYGAALDAGGAEGIVNAPIVAISAAS
ncbi:MAG TPA: S8 family serine peptidase [Acidimicrobiales bacterium]|nr:S8 family serine peptidase [Acidimicrobiales bacterium]